ncbi:putative disease resistance protein RGA3 [Carex rostrata]
MVMILTAFLPKFGQLLVQMVQDEAGLLLGIPGQIEKLSDTVHDIQCVLEDAERKQSKSSVIERWLMQLKDIMYDADDIIDLCQIKAKECGVGSKSCASSNAHCGCPLLYCFCNPSFARKIGSKIWDINSRLEGIAKRKVDLGLTELQIFPGLSDHVRRVEDSIISRKTDPVLILSDIVGDKIEEDTKLLVNWLTEINKGVRENVGVVAIVGMGGIGKTTLAKRIFKDLTQEEFQLKIWLCVSKEVKELELLKCVIRELRGDYGAAQERSELVPLLESIIQEKKFLLILDDVWQETQAVWDDLLCAPMSAGAHGSQLLVTTRDEIVAKRMKATKLHWVDKLSDKDGWSLLIRQVIPNGIESEIQDPGFHEIGMQIVKKCDGLPLAIKSIGGVLCTKGITIGNWQSVLKSKVWSIDGLPEDVHHALYLSYEDLPPPLKQCFIFCSLFPEDFVFRKTDLIYRWFVEGFLQDKKDFWELGSEYYRELLLRNFLEVIGHGYDKIHCKMHDILGSFARQLGKYENCVLWEGQVLSRPESVLKIRRLSIEGNEINTEVIKKEKGLRTLLLHSKPEIGLNDLCRAFSNLRTLDLSFSNFSSLPNSLCGLMHLRYLDVSFSKIRNLPNSIGNLKCLVFLNLFCCKDLSHVPISIINLQELKYLCTSLSGVRAIPSGLNKLDKLAVLYGFKPDKNNLEGFSSLDGIETLSQLINLQLCSLEKVLDENIAKRANLQNKDRLQFLKLLYTSLSFKEQLSQSTEKKRKTEDVLNELCPPPSLEVVVIEGYLGNHLPSWLKLGANFPNLRFIQIRYCACFKYLVSLGQLPNLDCLRINGAYSVESVGEEFLWEGNQSRDIITMSCPIKAAFPKLSQLVFEQMPNWNKGQPAMPKLKELFIISCPQLRSLPEGLLHYCTSLEYLKIHDADKLITTENLPSVKDVLVLRIPNLVRISNLPNISYIKIEGCPKLKTLDNLKPFPRMALSDYEMETLPNYLTMTMPQKLTIRCSEELLLKIASQGKSGSEWNRFKHIASVTIYSSDESHYAIYQKIPFSFTTNISTSRTHQLHRISTKGDGTFLFLSTMSQMATAIVQQMLIELPAVSEATEED